MDPFAWRLRNQKLVRTTCRAPEDVVRWHGAMQAQDYTGAKWALGLRLLRPDDGAIDRAFDEGRILRTHMMRPTWHFVVPQDIRWIQKLTGPRVHRISALYYRRGGLDKPVLRRGVKVIERSLRDRTYLTREKLGSALAGAGLSLKGEALAYLMLYAELECVICSGPREGRQFTYALVDERVPPSPAMSHDESLAALVMRYFTSHGPATFKDFAWWSGLTVRDAKAGVAMAGSALIHETIDGLTYWFAPGGRAPAAPASPSVFLLPNYDELGIAYRDRVVLHSLPRPAGMTEFDVFAHLLVIDRELTGRWRREIGPRAATIEIQPFRTLTKTETAAVTAAVERYGTFLRLPVTMKVVARRT